MAPITIRLAAQHSPRNVISGNDGDGVIIADGADPGLNATGNIVQGNYIGVAVDGTTALGNSEHGVHITTVDDNLIGGTDVGAGNLIANNAWAGVQIQNASATGISILGNEMYSNGGFGIDLGSDNLTPNDVGDGDSGANNLQNFAVLTSAGTDGNTIAVAGSLNTTVHTTVRVEFFVTDVAAAGNGEGKTYLGAPR